MKYLYLYLLLRLPVAFVLDLLFGDPSFIPHPVVFIGKIVNVHEKLFRALFAPSSQGKKVAGFFLVLTVCTYTFCIPFAFCIVSVILSFYLKSFVPISVYCIVEVFWGFQSLACRSLENEALNVYFALNDSLDEGRNAVGRIVGRDVSVLSEEGVIKACVETVAENTTDGIISPMIAFALGGAPLALLYKAINTMDSMIGYKNQKYIDFGMCAARLDDFANFIAARIAAFYMILTGFILYPLKIYSLHFHPVNSIRIFFRDRNKHASPNSAQTESVCAGLLGVKLAGNAFYEGSLEKKPFIGEQLRDIQKTDIIRSILIMHVSSALVCITITLIFVSLFYF